MIIGFYEWWLKVKNIVYGFYLVIYNWCLSIINDREYSLGLFRW